VDDLPDPVLPGQVRDTHEGRRIHNDTVTSRCHFHGLCVTAKLRCERFDKAICLLGCHFNNSFSCRILSSICSASSIVEVVVEYRRWIDHSEQMLTSHSVYGLPASSLRFATPDRSSGSWSSMSPNPCDRQIKL